MRCKTFPILMYPTLLVPPDESLLPNDTLHGYLHTSDIQWNAEDSRSFSFLLPQTLCSLENVCYKVPPLFLELMTRSYRADTQLRIPRFW